MNTPQCACHLFPPSTIDRTLDQTPELAETLEFVSKDPALWSTLYQCKVCGCNWRERYDVKGYTVTAYLEKTDQIDNIIQGGPHA